MNNIFSILKWDAMRNLNLLRKSVDKGKEHATKEFQYNLIT